MYKLMKTTDTMIKVRANIEEALFVITKGAFSEGASVVKTAMVIDNLIDFCEGINVYDEGELREIFAKILEESIKNEEKNH